VNRPAEPKGSAGGIKGGGRAAGRWTPRRRFFYSTVVVAAGLISLELLLRLSGFRYSPLPMSMEYVRWISDLGHTQATSRGDFQIRFRADPDFFWVPVAQAGATNSLGFRGREWRTDKAPATTRILALGDSCTIAGDVPYPERLETRLNAAAGFARYEVYNAGVGSWSSYQGRRFLEQRALDFKPDIVTIYFGWNDHWLAWSHPDRELAPYMAGRSRWVNWAQRSRLAQALTWTANRVVPRPDPRDRDPPQFRVGLSDYEDNLRSMSRTLKERGAAPLFVTAPSALHANHPVVRYLCEQSKLFHDPGRIAEVHAAYNDAVRRVARQEGALISDLAREALYRPDAPRLFTADGIHLSEDGLDWAAEEIGRVLLEKSRESPAQLSRL
jgi:lysophospholipase L1-like esterase